MTDALPPAAGPEAIPQRGIWPGLVWAIPLAALLIVLFLGIRALANQGVDVVVTFDSAAGLKVGDTKVTYQGYEVGHVTRIDVDKNIHDVDVTLRLESRAKSVLNTDTVFWLIGAKPSLTNLSSVKAAFAGLAIGIAPGFNGRPTRHFRGLNDEPVVPPGTPGARFVLTGQMLGSVQRGSPLLYQGQEIGKVTDVALVGAKGFRLEIFVEQNYRNLVRPGALFWVSSPLQVSLAGGELNARIGNTSALLSGGVDMELPDTAETTPSPAGSQFVLYKDHATAQAGPPGPQVPYGFTFPGLGGDLSVGAPVNLLSFPVGTVRSVRLVFDKRTGAPYTAVIADLDAEKLQVDTSAGQSPDNWRGATDAVVARLLAKGYRARLVQKPPLIGGRIISLDEMRAVRPALLISGDPPEIPAAAISGDIDDLTSQADQILAKVNRIPIEAIGQDVRQITSRLNHLVSSPQVTDSLQHLDSTLKQVDAMMVEVKPQIGPLVTKLNQAADQMNGAAAAAKGLLSGENAPQDAGLPDAIRQMTDAARAVRTLADYLARHPEAVIKGKSK